MEYTKLKNINFYKSENINPSKYPNDVFEMYSVPIYETGHPEYLRGEEIASSKSLVKKNDILLCKINPRINRVWIVKDESDKINIASSEWIVIRNDEYNPEFLAWYLRSPKFQKLMTSEVTGIGGSLTRAQPKRVAEYPVPVLPLREQNEIANVLNKAKRIIDNRKQELFMLDELIKARFVEMFGDPIDNPRSYPVHQLSEYITSLTSGSRGWAKYCVDEGKEWFITIKNVKDCHISTDNMQPVNAPDNAEAKRTKVQEGDLLISITADLGRTGVVTKEIAKHGAYINQHLSCVRINRDVLNPLFVAYYMESPAGKEQFTAKNQNAVKAGLNFNSINSLRLMVPPLTEQNRFIDFIAQVDKSKLLLRRCHSYSASLHTHVALSRYASVLIHAHLRASSHAHV